MRTRAPSAVLFTAATLVVACGGGERASADSALARDLTLATGSGRPAIDSALTLGGDTAATRPATPVVSPPAPAARVAAPSPARTTPARSAVRQTEVARAEPAVRRAPARPVPPRPAPAPVEEAVEEAPVPTSVPAVAEATPAPAAGPASGAGRGRALAAGTLLAGTLGQRVCTESNRPGDRFVATLDADASGPGGATLPAGTPVVLEFARATGEPPTVEFVVRGVSVGGEFVPIVAEASPVTGDVERRQVVDKPGSAKGKAVQGAIAGAILGRVLGGGTKGTVIGAAGGAAAGAAMGRGRSHEEACLTPGAPVRVRLSEALALR